MLRKPQKSDSRRHFQLLVKEMALIAVTFGEMHWKDETGADHFDNAGQVVRAEVGGYEGLFPLLGQKGAFADKESYSFQ